jgi:DNA-binding CsgD family transcriptional regulator
LSVFLLGGYVPAPFALTVERARRSGPFSADEIAAMKAALPHFRRAARLTIAVGEAAQNGMVDAFSALNRAAILLDDLGAVVRVNAPAEALLGDALVISRGRLRASASGADRALAQLVAAVCRPDAAIATPKADAIAVRRESELPLVVQAAPLVNAARDIFQCARAILLIMPLHRLPEVGEAILHQAFGLTPAEVNLARLIIAGKTMPEAAAELGVSAHTTRTHLRSMFAKTQTLSQSELAVMVSRLSGGRTAVVSSRHPSIRGSAKERPRRIELARTVRPGPWAPPRSPTLTTYWAFSVCGSAPGAPSGRTRRIFLGRFRSSPPNCLRSSKESSKGSTPIIGYAPAPRRRGLERRCCRMAPRRPDLTLAV